MILEKKNEIMKKYRNEISKIYRAEYSKLEKHYAILMSEVFIIPTLDEFTSAIEKHSVVNIKYISNISDCEKLAWYLVNGIQRERSENAIFFLEDERATWSIGWATGLITDLFGTKSHTLVTALTSDFNIVFVDPTNNRIQKYNEEDFNLLLLVM